MRKKIVGIFAHPDDESFGPGGTIAKLAKKNDVYIICVTSGEAGQNDLAKSQKKLSDIRHEELENAGKILGIKKRFPLKFEDGELNNNLYHKVAEEIEKIVKKLKPESIMTFEPKGVSGHIDHMAVSMITTYIFKRSKKIKTLMYYCIMDKRREKYLDDYFIYFPEGYKRSEIDKEVDISSTFNQKIKAIQAHKSQQKDVDLIVGSLLKMPPKEYFLISKK